MRAVPFNTELDKSHDVKICLLFISYKIGPFVNTKSVYCVLLVYTRPLNNAKQCKLLGIFSSKISSISIIILNSKPIYTNAQQKNRFGHCEWTINCCQWYANAHITDTIYLKVTFWWSTNAYVKIGMYDVFASSTLWKISFPPNSMHRTGTKWKSICFFFVFCYIQFNNIIYVWHIFMFNL